MVKLLGLVRGLGFFGGGGGGEGGLKEFWMCQTVLLGAVGMKEQGGIEGDAACVQDSLLHAAFNKVYVMFCILSTVFEGGNSY